jgi:hypothetical protein
MDAYCTHHTLPMVSADIQLWLLTKYDESKREWDYSSMVSTDIVSDKVLLGCVLVRPVHSSDSSNANSISIDVGDGML